MSYIKPRGRWCDIIVLNVPAPTQDKCDDTKNSFHEEIERVLDQFPQYHMKIFEEISMQTWVRKTFSNRQLEMTVYTKLVMVMGL
jgi:hypothetical protein